MNVKIQSVTASQRIYSTAGRGPSVYLLLDAVRRGYNFFVLLFIAFDASTDCQLDSISSSISKTQFRIYNHNFNTTCQGIESPSDLANTMRSQYQNHQDRKYSKHKKNIRYLYDSLDQIRYTFTETKKERFSL